MDSDGSNPIRIVDETLAKRPHNVPGRQVGGSICGDRPGTGGAHPVNGGPSQEISKDLVVAGHSALSPGSFQYSVAISPDGKLIAYLTLPPRLENPGVPCCFQTKLTEGNPFRRRCPVVPVRLAAVSQ